MQPQVFSFFLRKYHGEVLSAVRQKTGQSSSEAAASTDGDAADSGELRLDESSKQPSHRDEEHYLKYTSSDVHSERGWVIVLYSHVRAHTS